MFDVPTIEDEADDSDQSSDEEHNIGISDNIAINGDDARDLTFKDPTPVTIPVPDTHPTVLVDPSVRKRLQTIFFLLTFWRSSFNVTRRQYRSLLLIIQLIFAVEDPKTKTTKLTERKLDNAIGLTGLADGGFERHVVCTGYGCWKVYGKAKFTTVSMTSHEADETYNTLVPLTCDNDLGKGDTQGICGEQVGCKVIVDGEAKFTPKVVMCYAPLITCLGRMLMRPNIVDKLKEWQTRRAHQGIYRDMYDGRVWRQFWTRHAKPFQEAGRVERGPQIRRLALGLMLNVDWFQPFKHVQYSVGVVYWTIVNLPRAERYLPGNVIITHILPTGKEKGVNMNNVLRASVQQLILLCRPGGVCFTTPDGQLRVAAYLICVSCDQPAARKICGFVAVGGTTCCTRCSKKMERVQSLLKPLITKGKRMGEKNMKASCGGFSDADLKEYKRLERTHAQHCDDGDRWLRALNESQRKQLLHDTGSKYSILSLLSYFDLIRHTTIDPMHNILMGSANKTIKHFKRIGILTGPIIIELQHIINSVKLPRDVSSIRFKVAAGFSRMTADQYKVFWTVFAEALLTRERLGSKFTAGMREMVRALATMCRLTAATILTTLQIGELKTNIIKFCREYEIAFGEACVTINQHLHLHLPDIFLDFGPSPAFNLFGMERMNGVLGVIPNNVYAIEVCIMTLLLRMTALTNLPSHKGGHIDLPPVARRIYELLVASWTGTSDDSPNDSLRSTFDTVAQEIPLWMVSKLSVPMPHDEAQDEPVNAMPQHWPCASNGFERTLAVLHKCNRSVEFITFKKGKVMRDVAAYLQKLLHLGSGEELGLPLVITTSSEMSIAGQRFQCATKRSSRKAQCLIAHGFKGKTDEYKSHRGLQHAPYPAQLQELLHLTISNVNKSAPLNEALQRLVGPDVAMSTQQGAGIGGDDIVHYKLTVAYVRWYTVHHRYKGFTTEPVMGRALSDEAKVGGLITLSPRVTRPPTEIEVIHWSTYNAAFEADGWSSIVPLKSIVGRFAALPFAEKTFAVLPLPRRVYF